MIHKKNSRLVLPVLVLALTVPGLDILVGSQKTQTLTAAETVGTYSIDPWLYSVASVIAPAILD